MRNFSHPRFSAQTGLTLIELLIAMTLSTVITIAGVASLTMARQGFSSTDATSELENNARFATSVIQKIVIQAGYLEEKYAMDFGSEFLQRDPSDIEPNVKGFNKSSYKESLVVGTNTTPQSGAINNSDMLIIRYQTGESIIGTRELDDAMINCNGGTAKAMVTKSIDRMVNVFHIANSSGEPSLMCTWLNDSKGTYETEPLIQGVETMQILYGIADITKGTAPTDSAPETYLRADELTVSDNSQTLLNWRRVRSIRIGLILRGPVGSAPDRTEEKKYYPLGAENIMDSTADIGSVFIAPKDGRLRQKVTFTVNLRNPQNSL